MKIESFEEIEGWPPASENLRLGEQLARELTKHVYEATGAEKFKKDYGLRDQIQRAAGSVMHNILPREVKSLSTCITSTFFILILTASCMLGAPRICGSVFRCTMQGRCPQLKTGSLFNSSTTKPAWKNVMLSIVKNTSRPRMERGLSSRVASTTSRGRRALMAGATLNS